MKDQKHLLGKKKSLLPNHEMFQLPGDSMKRTLDSRTLPLSSQKGLKASKRGALNDVSVSMPDSVPDTSSSGSEYRALRRKYLLLEEESFGLGRELKVIEDEVKTLEEEKLSLLDELVVLEGLIDPADLKHQGQGLQ